MSQATPLRRPNYVNDEQTAERFERHRAHLTGVAYRMLGTLADAEDAVQETYLRFARANPAELRDVQAWLTTTVGRPTPKWRGPWAAGRPRAASWSRGRGPMCASTPRASQSTATSTPVP